MLLTLFDPSKTLNISWSILARGSYEEYLMMFLLEQNAILAHGNYGEYMMMFFLEKIAYIKCP